MTTIDDARPAPPGIITAAYTDDVELGVLKRGKEADVLLVERLGEDGAACLLVKKRFVRVESRAFKNNAGYRSHRRVHGGKRRDGDRLRLAAGGRGMQAALDKGTAFGRETAHSMWIDAEFATLQRLWAAGVAVPYPVELVDRGFLMEYIGDAETVAPRLAQARAERDTLPSLFEQVRDAVLGMAGAGVVHADLSAYNILLWDGLITVIDFPQSVPYLQNHDATDFLHRDCLNIATWFTRAGLEVDGEELFVDALSVLFDQRMQDLFRAGE